MLSLLLRQWSSKYLIYLAKLILEFLTEILKRRRMSDGILTLKFFLYSDLDLKILGIGSSFRRRLSIVLHKLDVIFSNVELIPMGPGMQVARTDPGLVWVA
jgi:hypothetical protein